MYFYLVVVECLQLSAAWWPVSCRRLSWLRSACQPTLFVAFRVIWLLTGRCSRWRYVTTRASFKPSPASDWCSLAVIRDSLKSPYCWSSAMKVDIWQKYGENTQQQQQQQQQNNNQQTTTIITCLAPRVAASCLAKPSFYRLLPVVVRRYHSLCCPAWQLASMHCGWACDLTVIKGKIYLFYSYDDDALSEPYSHYIT